MTKLYEVPRNSIIKISDEEKKEGVAEVIACLDRYNQLYKDEINNI